MINVIEGLNQQQIEAVLAQNPRVLVLAGAGSGKTKTITSRIIHLLLNEKVRAQEILALTFTNKAAGEMRERVSQQVPSIESLMIKTFHSFGAYILRQCHEAVGRTKNFVIYDEDDSTKLINEILDNLEVEKPDRNYYKKAIKQHKQELEKSLNLEDPLFSQIYELYNLRLKQANAFDFEDLILQTVKSLKTDSNVVRYIKNRYSYILVDEYQDTNFSQFNLLQELLNNRTQLMVVGDEDQSIYRFRGAVVELILNFPKYFPDAQIIRLETNYRSTAPILEVANSLIQNNQQRLGKTLVPFQEGGAPVYLLEHLSDIREAEAVVELIKNDTTDFKDNAVLVRTNNQTRTFEQSFMRADIPYTIVGSIGFFEREEIKDSLAIIRFVCNSNDIVAFRRFANKPSRGIGKKSLDTFTNIVRDNYNGNIMKALKNISNNPQIKGKALKGFQELYEAFENSMDVIKYNHLDATLAFYLDKLGLFEYYQKVDISDNSYRIEYLRELSAIFSEVEPGLENIIDYLQDNALIGQADSLKTNDNTVKILTVHNAKGLEFDTVFVCGVERDIFPHANSIIELEEGMEEERRLFYVAITRAKKKLYLSYAHDRSTYGQYRATGRSCFFDEIPDDLLQLLFLQKNVISQKKSEQFALNDMVVSPDYGSGKIVGCRREGKYQVFTIDFYDYGIVELIAQFSRLEKKND